MLCKLSSDWLEIDYVTSKLLIEKIKVGLILRRKQTIFWILFGVVNDPLTVWQMFNFIMATSNGSLTRGNLLHVLRIT